MDHTPIPHPWADVITSPRLRQAGTSQVPVAVIDLEMTGLDRNNDRICEVGIVRSVGGEVERTYETLVQPGVPMTPGAQAVHRISADALLKAPHFEDIAEDIADILSDAVIVAHHVAFDLAYLCPAMQRAGHPLTPVPTLDTLEIARRMFAFRSHRLAAVCEALAVPLPRAHRALGDAHATHSVFQRIMGLLDPSNELTVGALEALIDQLALDSSLRRTQEHILRAALETQRTVWFDYLSPTVSDGYIRTRREVEIWAVKPPRFQGYCRLRKAERVFRMERIHDLQLGDAAYEVPEFKARV